MHSWCTPGAHLVNSLPFHHPSISPYRSPNPYLFYLYLHIYPSIHSISTSIPLFILSLSPHLSLYLSYFYLHIYHSIYSISTSIPLSILSLSPYLSLYPFYLHIYPSLYSIAISTSIPPSILSYLCLHIYHFIYSIFTTRFV